MTTKYIFIQNDPFYLPMVLDKYLEEYASTTAGIDIQSVAQGKRTVYQTALDLYKLYGFSYFQWKLRKYLWRKIMAKVFNDILGITSKCWSVKAIAKKYNIPVTTNSDVNSDSFRKHLKDKKVDFIVSISGTQFYGKKLRDQIPLGIVNCHGALLPKYRGLMPSFWTLANGEKFGGVSVHYVNEKIDDGPIIVQKKYSIIPNESLENLMLRSKKIAADAIIECVRLVENGNPKTIPNPIEEMTHFSMPTKEHVKKLFKNGHTLK